MTVEHQMAYYVALPPARRYEAATALGTLWRRHATRADFVQRWADPVRAALESALRDEHPTVRWSAVRGLERLGDARPLADALDDPIDWVRRRAIAAVGRLGPDPYAARLAAALHSPATCIEAAEALGRLARPTPETLDALSGITYRYGWRPAARSTARLARRSRRLAPIAAARLSSWSTHADAYRREAALCGLALLRPSGWLAPFRTALTDPEPELRIRAAELLLRHAGDRAGELVGRLADDPDARVRRRLTEALDRPA